MQGKLRDKVGQIWPGDSSDQVPAKENENEGVYTVSAVVRLPDEGDSGDRPLLPFFSCPRKYFDPSEGGDDPGYLCERLEESDILGPIAMALKARSVADSLNLILTAFPPRDTVMIESTPEAERTLPLLLGLH